MLLGFCSEKRGDMGLRVNSQQYAYGVGHWVFKLGCFWKASGSFMCRLAQDRFGLDIHVRDLGLRIWG